MKVCVNFADCFGTFPLLLDPLDLNAVFEVADNEQPDVFIHLHPKFDFLNRADFKTSQILLQSIYKYGAILEGVSGANAILASNLKIAEKSSNSSSFFATLDAPIPLTLVISPYDYIDSAIASHVDNLALVCSYGQGEIKEQSLDALQKAGFVSVAGLEETSNVSAGCNVRFFLSRPPKEVELRSLASSSLIDFTC